MGIRSWKGYMGEKRRGGGSWVLAGVYVGGKRILGPVRGIWRRGEGRSWVLAGVYGGEGGILGPGRGVQVGIGFWKGCMGGMVRGGRFCVLAGVYKWG